MKYKITILSALICCGFIFLFFVNSNELDKTKTVITSSESIKDLYKKLPNLQSLEAMNCIFIMSTANTRSALSLPSPSDIIVRMAGTITLSNDSWRNLQSKFYWASILRNDIPAGLRSRIPEDMTYYVSEDLNSSFSQNARYAHGFVVRGKGDDKKLYFIAQDIDHPI